MSGVYPYAGTSGHSGSDTSRERAERQDADGTTSMRQRALLNLLNEREEQGATWPDVALRMGLHHGAASGLLSAMHKEGLICRLSESRARCKVYVTPAWVADRPTEAHGRTSRTALMDDMAALIRRLRDTGLMPAHQQMNDLLERHNRTKR